MPGAESTAVLRTIAMRLQGVEEGVACAGTAAESRTFKTGNKAFLFAREASMMVKLQESLAEAQELAEKEPKRFKAGAGGWVTVDLKSHALPAKALVTRWIAESYQLMHAALAKKREAS